MHQKIDTYWLFCLKNICVSICDTDNVLECHQLVLTLESIHTVIDCNVADIIIREHHFDQFTCFQIRKQPTGLRGLLRHLQFLFLRLAARRSRRCCHCRPHRLRKIRRQYCSPLFVSTNTAGRSCAFSIAVRCGTSHACTLKLPNDSGFSAIFSLMHSVQICLKIGRSPLRTFA